MYNTVGFIGCGNMGGALVSAVSRTVAPSLIFVSDLNTERTDALHKELGVTVATAEEIAEKADFIVLGVKPQVLGATLASLKPAFAARDNAPVLVSMAAGVSIARIREMLGEAYPIVRIMPNTPASVGEGVILWGAEGTDSDAENFFQTAFSAAGLLDRIEERLIDAASALSGCGPAFVALFAEALADGAVACGLPRDKAILYAEQTLLGTASLLLKSGKHPGEVKDAVCSPGGTTIEGVRALEEGGLRGAAMDAVIAAYKKTLALGK